MILKKFQIYCFLIFYFVSNIAYANYETSIVVKVDNEIITNFEIKNKILSNLLLSGKKINQKNINGLKKKSLDELIQMKIKIIELSKYNISIDRLQIDQYLKSISSNNVQNLKDKFRNSNLDFALFEKYVETELMWQKYIYQIYSKKIDIDTNQVKDELKELVKKNQNILEYNLSEIEVAINNNENIKIKIDDIKNKIIKEGFETAAQNHSFSDTSSNKGYIGWISSKELSKNIFEIIRKLKIGEVSTPIRRQNTILFLKVNDIRSKKVEELDQQKLELNIVNRKKNELFDLYSKSHLSKIRNNTLVEYK